MSEQALNRRASLLARELRSRFEHEATKPYVEVLRVARDVVDTIVGLEHEWGGVATWLGSVGSVPSERSRDKAREHLDGLRMADIHSSDVDPGDPYR